LRVPVAIKDAPVYSAPAAAACLHCLAVPLLVTGTACCRLLPGCQHASILTIARVTLLPLAPRNFLIYFSLSELAKATNLPHFMHCMILYCYLSLILSIDMLLCILTCNFG